MHVLSYFVDKSFPVQLRVSSCPISHTCFQLQQGLGFTRPQLVQASAALRIMSKASTIAAGVLAFAGLGYGGYYVQQSGSVNKVHPHCAQHKRLLMGTTATDALCPPFAALQAVADERAAAKVIDSHQKKLTSASSALTEQENRKKTLGQSYEEAQKVGCPCCTADSVPAVVASCAVALPLRGVMYGHAVWARTALQQVHSGIIGAMLGFCRMQATADLEAKVEAARRNLQRLEQEYEGKQETVQKVGHSWEEGHGNEVRAVWAWVCILRDCQVVD